MRQARSSSSPRVQVKDYGSSNLCSLRCAIIPKKAREFDLTWASASVPGRRLPRMRFDPPNRPAP